MRFLLALALGAMLATALASCAQILGLDEHLEPVDTSADAAGNGDGNDGGRDATTDGGMGGGNDASDGSLADGADGDGGGGGGGSDAESSAWQLDKSYGNDGAAVLVSGSTDDQPDLELVYVGDGAAIDAGVYAVGVAIATDTGISVLDVFNADQPGAAPNASLVAEEQGPATYRLLGAFPSSLGITAFAQNVDTLAVQKVALTSSGPSLQSKVSIASGVTISRLVQQDANNDFSGPGTLGSIDDGDAKGVEVTVGVAGDTAVVDRGNDLLLAEGVASGSGTWFGGYAPEVPLSAVAIQRVDGGAESTLLNTGPSDDWSSVTDFAAAGNSLFAVGYVGSSFALWRIPADYGTAPAFITPTGSTDFVGGEACPLPGYFCFIRSAVTDDDAIVVSGALGDPYLATFDGDGNETKLLTPLDGGSPVSFLDVAPLLPTLNGDGQWNAGAVLALGDLLYAAFASSGSNPAWAVVRLRRGAGP